MVRLSVWLNHQWTKVTHGCYWESTGLDWHIWGPRRNIKWWGQPLASNLLQSLPPDNLSAPNTTLCTLHRVTASSFTQITSVLHGHLPTVQLSNFAWQYYHGSCSGPSHPCPQILAPARGMRVSDHIPSAPSPSHHSGQSAPVGTVQCSQHPCCLPCQQRQCHPYLLRLRSLSKLLLPKHLQFAPLHHVPPQGPTWATIPKLSGLDTVINYEYPLRLSSS